MNNIFLFNHVNILKKDIVIIGAGITGLTAAYYLSKYKKDLIVLEKDMRAGGVINTNKETGFIYETGPNSGILSTIEAVQLFEDLNQVCRLETANEKSKKRLIWKGNSWKPQQSSSLPVRLQELGGQLQKWRGKEDIL